MRRFVAVKAGYDKAAIRERIQEVTARPVRDLVENEISAVGLKKARAEQMDAEALERLMPKFRSTDDIHLVVAGADAGKFSGAFHGWATGEIGSMSVSRRIEEL